MHSLLLFLNCILIKIIVHVSYWSVYVLYIILYAVKYFYGVYTLPLGRYVFSVRIQNLCFVSEGDEPGVWGKFLNGVVVF